MIGSSVLRGPLNKIAGTASCIPGRLISSPSRIPDGKTIRALTAVRAHPLPEPVIAETKVRECRTALATSNQKKTWGRSKYRKVPPFVTLEHPDGHDMQHLLCHARNLIYRLLFPISLLPLFPSILRYNAYHYVERRDPVTRILEIGITLGLLFLESDAVLPTHASNLHLPHIQYDKSTSS